MTEGLINDAYQTGIMKNHLIDKDDSASVQSRKLREMKNEDLVSGWMTDARDEMGRKMTGSTNPVVAFARLAAFFAGQQSFKMQVKLKIYEEQHNYYKDVLDNSKIAHQGKLSAASAKKDKKIEDDDARCKFNVFMNNHILEDGGNYDRLTHFYGSKLIGDIDPDGDNKHNKDQWDGFIQMIDKEKDIASTDLNKLSTEMDMAVKESDSAQQMAANAIKKANDLLYEQAKTSGG